MDEKSFKTKISSVGGQKKFLSNRSIFTQTNEFEPDGSVAKTKCVREND